MSLAIVTGSAGLVGSEATRLFAARGLDVVGIDNDMRRSFFGSDASTDGSRKQLEREVRNYRHESIDIRDRAAIDALFQRHGGEIALVLHAAAQPSHDWAAQDPHEDFSINATGTLNLLEATRRHAADAAFLFTSTNKVYGDTPNHLPLEERDTRWELPRSHPFGEHGIDESMSIDASLHSLFGASKVAADLLVQEYGRYFGLKTASFRCGCLTGPAHAGTMLHGFLAYLVRCAVVGEEYTVLGYQGKQVRDNIHAHDLASAFWHFFEDPEPGEVYNMGGSRYSNCSMLEAIQLEEELLGAPMRHSYRDENRRGDHIWWISDVRKFQKRYPAWTYRYDMRAIMEEIHEAALRRVS